MLDDHLGDLVTHLIGARQLDSVIELFAGSEWLKFRAFKHGLDFAHQDVRQTVDAAIRANRDELVAPALAGIEPVGAAYKSGWADGSSLVDLATASDADRVRGIVRATGEEALPWSAMLGSVRLIDLGAIGAAAEMLADVARRGWPNYVVRTISHALESLAGIGVDPTAEFLCWALEAAPAAAARIVVRLYEGVSPGSAPNRFVVWAAVLHELIQKNAGPALITAALDLTDEVVLPGVIPVGLHHLYEARLEAVSHVAGRVDAKWRQGQILKAVQTVGDLCPHTSSQDAEKTVLQVVRTETPLLNALVAIITTSRDAQAETEFLSQIQDQLPIPASPTRHDFGDRSLILARYAAALRRLGHSGFMPVSTAALKSAELDCSSSDPPRGYVALALTLLADLDDPTVASRARALLARFQLDEAADTKPGLVASSVRAVDHFERGLALIRMAREGNSREAILGASKTGLPLKRRTSRDNDEVDFKPVRECAMQALIRAWSHSGVATALDHIRSLDALRPREQREAGPLNEHALRRSCAASLARRKERNAALRLLLEAPEEDDLKAVLENFRSLLKLDPNAAERAFEDIDLTQPGDVGCFVASALSILDSERRTTPEVTDDTIRRWAARYPLAAESLRRDEFFLLTKLGGCNVLPDLLSKVAKRVVSFLERSTVLDADPVDEAGKKQRERHYAALSAVAAVRHLVEETQSRFIAILQSAVARVQERRPKARPLLTPVAKPDYVVRLPQAAMLYLQAARVLLGDSVPGDPFENLNIVVATAVACRAIEPIGAKSLVAAAFEAVRERRRKGPPADPVPRSTWPFVEMLAGVFGRRPAGAAQEFADQAARWIDASGDDHALSELRQLASEAVSRGERDRIMARVILISQRLYATRAKRPAACSTRRVC